MSAPEKLPAPAPTLPPPAGHRSWLAYAVATMDMRSLQNDHDWGNQTHWPADVTREQMTAAAMAELRQIEGIWDEFERACEGKITTTAELADWAEKEIAKRETGEVTANPAATKAIEEHRAGKTEFGKISDITSDNDEHAPVVWRGRDLNVTAAIMYYAGRLNIDSIRGAVSLPGLDGSPCVDEVLHADSYEVELRVIRRLPK